MIAKPNVDIDVSLNLLLEKSLHNEIGYLKILKYTDNHEMLELLDNRHEASCFRVLSLKKHFLELNIEPINIDEFKVDEISEWLDVKSILSKSSRKEIFDEILIAEKKCVEDYKLILKQKKIPKKLKLLLTQQKKGIELSIINLKLSED